MKIKSLKTFLSLIAISATALCTSAQSAKIMVVDMAKVYDSHYKTEEQNAKLRGDEQRAQEELEKLGPGVANTDAEMVNYAWQSVATFLRVYKNSLNGIKSSEYNSDPISSNIR